VKLAPEQTTALQRRVREEGVTIHAAISAAVAIAGRDIDGSWRNNPLRINSPADIRDVLGLKDECMVSFTNGEISVEPGGSMKFWELARFAKHGLSSVKSTESIFRMIDLQSTAVSSNPTVEDPGASTGSDRSHPGGQPGEERFDGWAPRSRQDSPSGPDAR
jgi:hypothetical protein